MTTVEQLRVLLVPASGRARVAQVADDVQGVCETYKTWFGPNRRARAGVSSRLEVDHLHLLVARLESATRAASSAELRPAS